jgi:hypothetical protein
MRYAENWTKVDIEHFDFEKVLAWCNKNLKGKQFIEKKAIKFDDAEEAALFKLKYRE